MMAAPSTVYKNNIFIDKKWSFQTAVKQVFENKKLEICHTVKVYWPRKAYDGKYDILLHLNHLHQSGKSSKSTTDQQIQTMANLLSETEQITSFISQCDWINNDKAMKQLGVIMDRALFTADLLTAISKMGCKYGQQESQMEKSIFVQAYVISNIKPGLTQIRSLVMCNLIERLLNFIGCNVSSNTTHYRFINNFTTTNTPENGIFVNDEHRQLHLRLENDMHIFVVAESLHFACMNAFKELKNDSSDLSFISIVHGLVTLNSAKESSPSHLYQEILEEIQRSSAHKLDDCDGLNDSEEANRCLAELTLKMDLLSRLTTHTVKSIDASVAVKNSAFVMYNYARICVLLERFEEKVGRKLIPTFPRITEVDFSLLKREEEWQIVSLCAKYPDVILEICEDLFQREMFSCHKLIKYLMEFSHCVSVYYNRINILADLGSHLQSILYARIHLIKCVKQIMENMFSILNLKPISRM